MQDYQVSVVIDASVGLEVTASTPEEAEEMALERDEPFPALCHHCAGKLDLGDPVGVIVSDGAKELYSSLPQDDYARKLAHARQVIAAAKVLVERLPVRTLAAAFDPNTEHEMLTLLLREVTQ